MTALRFLDGVATTTKPIAAHATLERLAGIAQATALNAETTTMIANVMKEKTHDPH